MRTTENYIGLIGFGSQGKAWALNLRDSGENIAVFLRTNSSSWKKAQDLGFEVFDIANLSKIPCDFYLLLIPDNEHQTFLLEHHAKLPTKSKLVYAHGFSVSHQKLATRYPQFHHLLLAPKAIASEVRFQFETQGKLLGVYSARVADQTTAEEKYHVEDQLAHLGIKLGLTSIYASSFEEETKADLFSEQALLCSLLPYGAKICFEKLVKEGIDPKLALLECFLELRSISKALVDLGPSEFFQLISPNALLGSEKAQALIFDQAFEQKLDILWNDIQSGEFQKTCDRDVTDIRNDILKRFEQSPLSKTFNQLKEELS